VWAATILYPSSKHTALVKNSHQYALQQKITIRLPLVFREVQPAIIPLKQHYSPSHNQAANLAKTYLALYIHRFIRPLHTEGEVVIHIILLIQLEGYI